MRIAAFNRCVQGGRAIVILIGFAGGTAACGQCPDWATASSGSGSLRGNVGSLRSDAVRKIEDSGTGERWLLLRDDNHTGGPGRLVVAGPSGNAVRGEGSESDSVQRRHAEASVSRKPIIRAGDRLVIHEDSARVDVLLEGVALTPALAGSSLKVRLNFGGGIVRAIAVGPGRATLSPQTEFRP
jgi:hypothetical protein